MKEFFKENAVLVAGIALPLVLTIIFFALTQIEKANTPPPQHSVVYTTGNAYNSVYKVIVKDGKAYLSVIPQDDKKKHHRNQQKPNLFIFNPTTEEHKQIELPDTAGIKDKAELLIEGLKQHNLNTQPQSPDGYRFTYNYRSNGNLMTEMFGGGYRSRTRYVLENGSVEVRVPNASRYNTQFVAWVE